MGGWGVGAGRVFCSMRTAFVLPYLLPCCSNSHFAADLISLCSFLLKHSKWRLSSDPEISSVSTNTFSDAVISLGSTYTVPAGGWVRRFEPLIVQTHNSKSWSPPDAFPKESWASRGPSCLEHAIFRDGCLEMIWNADSYKQKRYFCSEFVLNRQT